MSQLLPYLLFLSCPVSMGFMMRFMMRGGHGGNRQETQGIDPPIARLERQVEELRKDLRETAEAR